MTEQDEASAGTPDGKLGRDLDIAGIAAGIMLGIIVFDVLSGGKLTRLARGRKKPCGCAEAAGQDQERPVQEVPVDS